MNDQVRPEDAPEGGTGYRTYPKVPEDPRTMEDKGQVPPSYLDDKKTEPEPETIRGFLNRAASAIGAITQKPTSGPYGEFGDMVRIRDEMDALGKLLSSKRQSRARKQVKAHFARIAQLALNAYLS